MTISRSGLVTLAFVIGACSSSGEPVASNGGAGGETASAGMAGAVSTTGGSGATASDAGGSSGTTASDAGGSGAGGSSAGAGGGDAGVAPSPPSQVPVGWKLLLEDDFSGSSLSSYWKLGTDQGTFTSSGTTYWDTWIPAESEYVTGSMVAIQNSNLILSTMGSSPISGDQGSKSYVSGYVNSYGSFAFQYGYIEIRAQMPAADSGSQTGLWPALWMFDSTYKSKDEIDIVESFGGDQSSVSMTVHDAALNQVNGTGHQVVVPISPGYHTFGALHQAASVSFYVDNKLEQTFDDALPSSMAINMGLQLGNASMGWISGPDPSHWGGGIHGANSADLKVDWVHVWTP